MDICLDDKFVYLSNDYLTDVNGGSLWGIVSGVFETAAGVFGIVGGIALLGIPEPTTVTKFAGVAAIVAGGAVVLSGLATIGSNIKH